MESDLLLTALATALVTTSIGALLWRHAAAKQTLHLQEHLGNTQQLEKELHIKERDFLAERNRLEIAQADNARVVRATAFEEGRKLGLTEGNAVHINELSTQRSALVCKYEAEREQALTLARDKLRAEYELQTKLFSVKISPYVSVREDNGFIRNTYETTAGYQYQLLVNGIPAFAPHVVAEQTEVKKEVNPEIERLLVQAAERAAQAAINMYLGGSPQFAKLAEPIIKRLPKLS